MDFIYKNWPKITGSTSIILFLILSVWFFFDPYLNIYIWFFWLHLPILMVHQFEEYIYPGGFKKTVNIKILKTGDPNFPLSDRLSFIINIGAWLLFIIAAIAGFSAIWLPVMLLFFNFGNALGHVFFGSIKLRNYNPGFFSSLFLIIPFSTFVIINLVGENLLTAGDIVISIAIGALLGATLPLSIGGNYLMHRKK